MSPIVATALLLLSALPSFCDSPSAAAPAGPPAEDGPIGYVDEDRDGINDRFTDENGDGIDEVSGHPYPHHFRFEDEDGDGLNDRFIDRDGDGVNDLEGRHVDRDADGFCDNIIDFDNDGVNDITGITYSSKSLWGYRYGRVFEERRRVPPRFRDENGDGMHDLLEGFHRRMEMRLGRDVDLFIDEDGDGIDDGRQFRNRLLRGALLERARKQAIERRTRARGERPESRGRGGSGR